MELDASDKRILKKLVSNHGCSYCELAKGLGIKAQRVLKRIRNMESDGIIKGYSIILDNKRLGRNYCHNRGYNIRSNATKDGKSDIAFAKHFRNLYNNWSCQSYHNW